MYLLNSKTNFMQLKWKKGLGNLPWVEYYQVKFWYYNSEKNHLPQKYGYLKSFILQIESEGKWFEPKENYVVGSVNQQVFIKKQILGLCRSGSIL